MLCRTAWSVGRLVWKKIRVYVYNNNKHKIWIPMCVRFTFFSLFFLFFSNFEAHTKTRSKIGTCASMTFPTFFSLLFRLIRIAYTENRLIFFLFCSPNNRDWTLIWGHKSNLYMDLFVYSVVFFFSLYRLHCDDTKATLHIHTDSCQTHSKCYNPAQLQSTALHFIICQ